MIRETLEEKKWDRKKKISWRQRLRTLFHAIPMRRSLRFYVFLLSFLMGVVPCIIMRWSILSNYETRVVNIQISEIQTQTRILANHLLKYDYLSDTDTTTIDAELDQFASIYDGRVLVINDNLKVVRDTYEMSTGKTVVSDDVVRCLTEGDEAVTTRYVKEDGYIEVIMPISETQYLEEGDYAGDSYEATVHGVLLVSVSTDSVAATLQVLGRRSQLILLVMVLVVFSLSVLASTYIVRPIEKLTEAFREVQSGYSSESVAVTDYRETRKIVEAFNQVVARMRSLDESRQDFVSNVSHELRTPMTSMKVLSESLLQMGDQVPPEMYREFLQDIDGELDRENKMIDELLNLSRMDRKQVSLTISSVDINEMVEKILKQLRPLAQKKDVALVLVSERKVRADIDEVKMSMVVSNLVENAIKYNVDHGRVTVTVDADSKSFWIICEDTGIGIPVEAQSRIFERFYRVDKSRSKEVGGTGLGLSITKSIVLLHRGTIATVSEEGRGSRFTVTIPLNHSTGAAEPQRKLWPSPPLEDSPQAAAAKQDGLRVPKKADVPKEPGEEKVSDKDVKIWIRGTKKKSRAVSEKQQGRDQRKRKTAPDGDKEGEKDPTDSAAFRKENQKADEGEEAANTQME